MASDAIDPSYRSSSSSELRVLSHYTFIRSKISSNIEDLDLLHQIYSWIPNNESIRPNPDILAKKRLKCQEILAIWESFKDYILHTVFKKHHMFVNNKYQAVNDRVYGKKIFVPNEFPYNLSSGHHWVMWYGSMFQPCSDEEITADILQELTKTLSTGMPLNSTATTTATAAIAVQNIQNAASMLSLLRTGVTSGQLPTIATNTAIVATATPTPTATSAGLGLGTGSIGGSEGNIDFDFAWYVNPKMTIPEYFHVQVFWTLL